MNTILIQLPLITDKKAEFEAMLHHEEGIALTSQQKGFISAEFGYTTDDGGNLKWNLWEKWETRENYEQYIAWRIESGMLEALAPILVKPMKPSHLSPQD